MPENIKPSEISEVLLQQLRGINASIQFDEVGTVLQVSDGVARIYGLLRPKPTSCWSLRTASWRGDESRRR